MSNKIKMKYKQLKALSLLEDGKSVFLTGPGGVGKTSVLKFFTNNTTMNIAITSTTGTSSLLINGTTLHSFLGIGLGKESVSKLVERITSHNWLVNRWRLLECLVIDEISMMNPILFDKLEEVARILRKSNEPFGGIQLVLSGDYLQLPCIGTMNFCFQAKSWNDCVPNVVYLDEIIRQGDKKFQNCLNSIRIGNITQDVKDLLNTRVGVSLKNDYGIKPTKLYSKNIHVERDNNIELDKLAQEGREFYAYEMSIDIPVELRKNKEYIVKKFTKFCPVAKHIELCIGAQVMLVKNIDLTHGLANGSRGVIMGFDSSSSMPIVRFLNGEERIICMEKWEMDERNKRVLRAYQIPLRVAFSLSIHKCQGCSLDYAEIDLSDVFEYGQAYVALSRVKTLSGLSIISIDYDCIQADPLAVSYYENLSKNQKT
jgi:ATP-dependent DNA helicase PIF1